MDRIAVADLEATSAFARECAARLGGREVLLLSGDLGAGKTTFVRYLAESMGLDPQWVSSPSFTLIQRYPGRDGSGGILHADLYRLRDAGEVGEIGLVDEWDSDDLIVVEWPDLLEEYGIPPGRPVIRIRFSHEDEGSREVRIE